MNVILGAGFILLVGLLASRLINRLKLPAVTAYLLLGIFIGPSVFNLLSPRLLDASGLISNLVLGLIAFGIGQNFSLQNFRQIGKFVLWISILEAGCAWILVTLSFYILLKQPFYLSLIFGAISAATAPAATVMVIREYKSKGPFTQTLLGVVAIDDAWCLIIFAVSLAISRAISMHISANLFLINVLFRLFLQISGALLLGSLVAFFASKLSRYMRTPAELLIYTLGFILLTTGIALSLHLSVLLANMFLAAVLVNINRTSFQFFDILKNIDTPLYLLFFVLAGAHLEIPLLKKIGVIGIGYLLFRVTGKFLGAYLGASFSKASKVIKKYLGWGLIPQAGVALGCALIAKSEFPSVGDTILSIIVATTIVYELIGPVCTKIALQKAGEIT